MYVSNLHVPDDGGAALVLVADLDEGRGGAVHPLPVHVDPLPGVGVLQVGVRLEYLLEQLALDGDAEVDLAEGGGHRVGGQLQLDGGEVAAAARGAVHQPRHRPRDRDRLEQRLGLRDDRRAGRVRGRVEAARAELGAGDHDRADVLVVVIVAAVGGCGGRAAGVSVGHCHDHRLHHNHLTMKHDMRRDT